MATTIELIGQELRDESGEQFYLVDGGNPASPLATSAARALVDTLAPDVWAELIKQDVDIRELGNDTYRAEVPYGIHERRCDADSIQWDFDIGSQQLHITHAKEHIKTYGLDDEGHTVEVAWNESHKGAMGVRDDGHGQHVEGCQVYIPIFTWSETHNIPYATVATYSWITKHQDLVATTNNATWRIWPKGELILLGVSGSKHGEGLVPVTFKFGVSRTKSDMSFSPITGVDAEGQHYVWVEYKPDPAGSNLTQEVKAVHVERVYEYANWSTMGLATPWT